MAEIDLSGKRVLILGAETEVGRAIAAALAEAGAEIALVAATTDAGSSFTVQRLARRLATAGRRALAQAIDATNEMAVRVMVRQVAKEMGGLNAAVFCAELGESTLAARDLAMRYATKEMARTSGRGYFGFPDVGQADWIEDLLDNIAATADSG